jgi:hypothetical protein
MSKLNPQKATAYVGPGVLRKGGKITPVPNGPLIKKKGPFKGSTLKAGGTIKKAQNGKTWQKMSQPEKASKINELKQKGGVERVKQYKDSVSTDAENRRNAAFEKNAATRGMTVDQLRKANKKPDIGPSNLSGMGNDKPGCSGSERASARRVRAEAKRKNGGMIKRADGSTSKRGLWDNIRANKGSGKKPTAAMLKQEKKIKAKK